MRTAQPAPRSPQPVDGHVLDLVAPLLDPGVLDELDELLAYRESGAWLTKFAWTKIVRHDLVKGRASPDDPDLAGYWAQRRRRNRDGLPSIGYQRTRLLRKQNGRCPICQGLLLHADHPPRSPEEWEQWAAATRKAITLNAITTTGSSTDNTQQRLVHEHCRRCHRTRGSPANPAP